MIECDKILDLDVGSKIGTREQEITLTKCCMRPDMATRVKQIGKNYLNAVVVGK
jgi:hypothetical protein